MENKADKNNGRITHPRNGVYLKQPTDYWAFCPAALPLNPPIDVGALEPHLSRANLALGKLEGIGAIIPDPELFVRMYVRTEAVLSSQIEGTQASLSDVLEDEERDGGDASYPHREERKDDIVEVRNYVRALNNGLARMDTLPLSLRLLKEMHATLMQGVRGEDKTPGEFRRSQNWIGPKGAPLASSVFIPPPVHVMNESLADFEKFVRAQDSMPDLVRAGVAHAQFETIHPFLDGNGRLGRLLITYLLCERKVLSRPLLYLSMYFSLNKAEYYDWLMKVRERGDWEGWLRFFLRGVEAVAIEAVDTSRAILVLQQTDRALVRETVGHRPNALRLLDHLYESPTVTVQSIAARLGISAPTANTLVREFSELGVLREITGRDRDRVFRHVEYLKLLTPRDRI